ncbi:MAG: PilZ domain-containing protein [Elusimicrobiota bacterium]
MSGGEDRRRSTRVLTEFSVTLRDDAGSMLDQHAVAHDVSEKGCKIEARAELKPGQFVRFALALDENGDIRGRARIVWCERSDLSYWAGVEFLKLSWRERRRVRSLTNPSNMDWDLLADKALFALAILATTAIGYRMLTNTAWRGVLADIVPSVLAAFALGWALIVLLRG